MTVVLVLAAVLVAAGWISRWDLRRPGAVAARAHHPFARPRPSARRLTTLFVVAVVICVLALAVLPHLDRFRFP